MNFSFEDYTLFIKGYSYDYIWHKQMIEKNTKKRRLYKRAQEMYEEKCRWKDFVREVHR